jgi:Tfp pilus assembly protein PilF
VHRDHQGGSAAGGSRPGLSVFATLWTLLPLLAGCAQSTVATFDSVAHTRQRLAQQLGDPSAAGQVQLPFVLDEQLRALAEKRVSRVGGDRWRVDQILDLVFGEIGLTYELTPTRNAVEAYATGKGNCLSFVNLFVGLGREARLNPFYVEVKDHQRWRYDRGAVISNGHIVAGMYIDGEMSTFDFLPYRAKSYRDLQPIDDLQATAHYYNNLGAEALLDGDLETARRHLELAVAIAPGFAKAANNLGVLHMRENQPQRALEVFTKALEQAGEDLALMANLARAYQVLGRDGEASALLAKLDGVRHMSPFYFLYRGEALLAAGDPTRALELMAKALRGDSELPEVHVGLVKTYLALGELDKARHHLSRALRLDATNDEARRLAAMIARTGEPVPPPAGTD